MGIIDGTKLVLYRYKISEFIILTNGDSDTVPLGCVHSLELTNDYENSVFPIFKVGLILDSPRYFKIMNNKNTVKFKLRIQKFYVKPGGEDKSCVRDWINETFSLIMDDLSINESSGSDELEKRDKSISSDAHSDFDNALDLYLYRDETTNAMKTQINEVLNGVTLTDAVGYMLGTAKITNALMSPMENNKVYSQLVIPPLTVNKAISYLDVQYGFYKSGSMIFFGLDKTYILNYKGGCTAFSNGEVKETNFLIPENTNVNAVDEGMLNKSSSAFYVVWKKDSINIENESISQDILNGNNAVVIDSSTTEIKTTTSKTITTGGNNTAIIQNDTENQWISETYTAQKSSNSVIITGAVKNIDVSCLTPNKKYNIIFEDSKLVNKYKGNYILANSYIRFVNAGGGAEFEAVASIKLKMIGGKKSNDSEYMEA